LGGLRLLLDLLGYAYVGGNSLWGLAVT
jgi:hypothetical protein